MSKRSKGIFYIVLIIIVLGAILYPKLKPLIFKDKTTPAMGSPMGQRSLNVEAMVIEPIALKEMIRSSGTLLPDEQVDLSFETSGKIININFEEGTPVEKGELLAKINDKPLQAQLQKLEAQKKLVDEREFRQKTLLSKDAISQEAYDQVITEQQSLEADINLVKARISETELRAPFSGVIGLRHVSEGSFVSQNHQIARLIKSDPLKIEFSVPERYAGEINPGQNIKFFLDGSSDTLSARVYAVDPKIDVNTRSITARALFSNTLSKIKPGRFVAVSIELNEISNALAIPTEALIPQMDGDIVYLYKQGKATSVKVQTGMRTEDLIQITQGINLGDTVVVTGILQIREGLPLEIDRIVN